MTGLYAFAWPAAKRAPNDWSTAASARPPPTAIPTRGLATRPLADVPLIRALADLSHRFDTLATPAWKKRFARHLMDIMAGGLRDIQLRDGGTPLPLSEYIPLRRDASAVLTCFDVIEICADTELPDQVYHSPILQEIILAGADLFAWINDLYSVDKEIACGIVSNLILVLQYERQLNRQQAFVAARALINDRVNDLLAAQQRLPKLIDTLHLDTSTQQAVHRYVAGIRDCIAGSNQWHAHGTRRYQLPEASGRARWSDQAAVDHVADE